METFTIIDPGTTGRKVTTTMNENENATAQEGQEITDIQETRKQRQVIIVEKIGNADKGFDNLVFVLKAVSTDMLREPIMRVLLTKEAYALATDGDRLHIGWLGCHDNIEPGLYKVKSKSKNTIILEMDRMDRMEYEFPDYARAIPDPEKWDYKDIVINKNGDKSQFYRACYRRGKYNEKYLSDAYMDGGGKNDSTVVEVKSYCRKRSSTMMTVTEPGEDGGKKFNHKYAVVMGLKEDENEIKRVPDPVPDPVPEALTVDENPF